MEKPDSPSASLEDSRIVKKIRIEPLQAGGAAVPPNLKPVPGPEAAALLSARMKVENLKRQPTCTQEELDQAQKELVQAHVRASSAAIAAGGAGASSEIETPPPELYSQPKGKIPAGIAAFARRSEDPEEMLGDLLAIPAHVLDGMTSSFNFKLLVSTSDDEHSPEMEEYSSQATPLLGGHMLPPVAPQSPLAALLFGNPDEELLLGPAQGAAASPAVFDAELDLPLPEPAGPAEPPEPAEYYMGFTDARLDMELLREDDLMGAPPNYRRGYLEGMEARAAAGWPKPLAATAWPNPLAAYMGRLSPFAAEDLGT